MKKLSIKLMTIFLLCLLGQSFLLFTVYIPFKKSSLEFLEMSLLKQTLKENKEVIYFGDSVVTTSPEGEKDRRSITKILATLTGKKIGELAHGAYSPDMYIHFIQFLLKQEHKGLKTIVIPINMRSFSYTWTSDIHYQFVPEKIKLAGPVMNILFYSPLHLFKYPLFLLNTNDKDASSKVLADIPKTEKEKDLISERLIKNYLYEMNDKHLQIQKLKEIMKLLSEAGIKIVFYFTPIDIEVGESYFSSYFSTKLKQNIELIQKILVLEKDKTRAQMEIINMAFDLKDASFGWHKDPFINEHLNVKGREHVAKRVAAYL
jgi:hypothetical protein